MGSMVSTSDLSKGMVLELDGKLVELMEFQHFKLGKGNSEARVRLKLRDVRTGSQSEKILHSGDRIAKANVDSRPSTYLYNDGDMYYFMDAETFEQKALSKDSVGDAAYYLTDGITVELFTYKDTPINVHLPTTVNLKIKEAAPGFKGDTAQSGTKPAKTDTGLSVDVPLFINEGDTITVDTRNGSYAGRK